MRKQKHNPRNRNLFRRGAGQTWYYKKVDGDKLTKISLKTCDDELARARRDVYEENGGEPLELPPELPTFADAAVRYLEDDTEDLSQTTRNERRIKLQSDVIQRSLGPRRLDKITPQILFDWWKATKRGRDGKTRRGPTALLYVDALSAVFGYYRDGLELLPEGELHAVDLLRRKFKRKSGTKAARIQGDPTSNKRPIEDPDALDRLLAAAQAESRVAHLVALLGVDAGLRLGEIQALRWRCIVWGDDENDLRRSLEISESCSKGLAPSPTKSGIERTVDLSRRLRRALLEHRGHFTPSPDAFVLGGSSYTFDGADQVGFRRRVWRRVLQAADVGAVQIKYTRDTFASVLFSMGTQLGYVSQQLGHADVVTTARHYSKWINRGGYRPPPPLEPGEHACDLIARVWPTWSKDPAKIVPTFVPTLHKRDVGRPRRRS